MNKDVYHVELWLENRFVGTFREMTRTALPMVDHSTIYLRSGSPVVYPRMALYRNSDLLHSYLADEILGVKMLEWRAVYPDGKDGVVISSEMAGLCKITSVTLAKEIQLVAAISIEYWERHDGEPQEGDVNGGK